MLRVEDLRGLIENDIVDHLRILGVKTLIKGGIRCPVLRERAKSLCYSARITCVIMSYVIVDSIPQVLDDLRQFLSDKPVLILLSRKVDPDTIYLGVPEN